MSFVNKRHGLSLQTYEDLYQWSIGPSSNDFWRDAFEWLELAPPGAKRPGKVLSNEVRQ